jgi:hypothetical protein
MRAVTETIAILTSSGGAFTGYSGVVNGRILEVRLVVPGSGGLAATTDITITNELTGATILGLTDQNGSGTWAPRQATHSTAGAAALYAAGGTAVNGHVVIAESRIKVVVAQGGDTLAGTLYVTVG